MVRADSELPLAKVVHRLRPMRIPDRLTKGRQREYADYIEEAKRADTKQRRLAKIVPMIGVGQGLNDKYR